MMGKGSLHTNIDDVGFQAIFAGLKLPILLLDSQQRLIKFNQYAQDVFQLEQATHLGQDAAQVLPWLAGRLNMGSQSIVDFKCVITTVEGERHAAVRVAALAQAGENYYLITLHDETEQKEIEAALLATQQRLLDFIDFLPDPTFAIDNAGRVTIWNRAMEQLTKIPKEKMLGQGNLAHSIPFWGERRLTVADMLLKGEPVLPLDGPYREMHWDGHTLYAECFATALNEGQGAYVWIKAAPLYDSAGNLIGAIETVRDITENRKALLALQTSEQRLRHITDNLLDIIAEIDPRGRILYISPSVQKLLGYRPDELLGRCAFDLIHPEDRKHVKRVLLSPTREDHSRIEFRCATAQGAFFWAEAVANWVHNEQRQLQQVIVAVRNVSDRKHLEERLTYLSWHDSLTGLYNRRYWQGQLQMMEDARIAPVSVLLCDVDGLKIVNDTMGHDAGDRVLTQVANILVKHCEEKEIAARIGGDEFAILLPGGNRERVLSLSQAIRQDVERYNNENPTLPLNVSIGIALRIDANEPIAAVVKRADDRMYREKLNRSHSVRNSLVQALSLALETRDFGTEAHTKRVQELAIMLAKKLGIPGSSQNDLRLLAQFHDIGKVGTPDHILHKPGPLTETERQEMQRHTEIGHRIALASPDLAPIADLILKHHEWWNGAGYPLGLKGQEIPLACRILAIVDAYDAMTSNRPYRSAMPKEEAIAELRRYAGTQFDPQLVPLFISLIEQELEPTAGSGSADNQAPQ